MTVHLAHRSNVLKQRPSWRLVLRCASLVACASLTLVWIASVIGYEARCRFGQYMVQGIDANLDTYSGFHPSPFRFSTSPPRAGACNPLGSGTPLIIPGYNGRSGYRVPMWAVWVMMCAAAVGVFRLTRSPPPFDCCAKCGYSRRGNVSKNCPECGIDLATVDRARAERERKQQAILDGVVFAARFVATILFVGLLPAWLSLYVLFLVKRDVVPDAFVENVVVLCWLAVATVVFVVSSRPFRAGATGKRHQDQNSSLH